MEKNDVAEMIGHDIADKADSTLVSMELPISPATHLACLRVALLEIRDTARKAFVIITGDNPWADELIGDDPKR